MMMTLIRNRYNGWEVHQLHPLVKRERTIGKQQV